MVIHAVVWVPQVLHTPVNVPSAIEMANECSSQLWRDVSTCEQGIHRLVVPLQLTGPMDSNPPHLVTAADLEVHQVAR